MADRRFAHKRGSILAGTIWMLLISLLLFWLPLLGPLIGGIVGGKRAGGVGAALLAALLPALVLLILVVVLGTVVGLPFIGVIAGAGVFLFVLADVGPLLIGALIGGVLA
jgi:hypothetical protein